MDGGHRRERWQEEDGGGNGGRRRQGGRASASGIWMKAASHKMGRSDVVCGGGGKECKR